MMTQQRTANLILVNLAGRDFTRITACVPHAEILEITLLSLFELSWKRAYVSKEQPD